MVHHSQPGEGNLICSHNDVEFRTAAFQRMKTLLDEEKLCDVQLKCRSDAGNLPPTDVAHVSESSEL